MMFPTTSPGILQEIVNLKNRIDKLEQQINGQSNIPQYQGSGYIPAGHDQTGTSSAGKSLGDRTTGKAEMYNGSEGILSRS